MRTISTSLIEKLANILIALALIFYTTIIYISGGSAVGFLWYIALSALFIFFSGTFICRLLLPKLIGWGLVGCSYVFGIAFLFFNYAIFGTIQNAFSLPNYALYSMFVLPFIFGILGFAILIRKFFNKSHKSSEKQSAIQLLKIQNLNTEKPKYLSICRLALSVCFCLGLFIYAFTGVLAFAHASSAGNMQYHQDMLWSVGNGASVAMGFPLKDIRVFGASMNYHYLSDAVPGFIAYLGNILPYNAACYYNYPILLFVFIGAANSAAKQYINPTTPLQTRIKLCALFPFCILFFHGFNSENTLNLLRNLNGVIAASALTCTVIFLLCYAQNSGYFEQNSAPKTEKAKFCLAFTIAIFALLLSKNLYAILIVCAIFAACLFMFITKRKMPWFALLLGVLGAVSIGFLWFLLFGNAVNNLVQSFWISPLNLIKTLIVWLPLGCGLYFISLYLSLRKLQGLSFCRLCVNAAAIGGIMAYFLFNHYSNSQVYFILCAILFIWFCALDAMPFALKRSNNNQHINWRRVVVLIFAVISLFGTSLTLLPEMQKGVQVALRCLNLRPSYEYHEDSVTPYDEQAAMWLRENMSPNEIFATNRNAKSLEIGEGTWHYLTALSTRQAFVESWRYAMDYGMDYSTLRHNLENVSDAIFNAETSSEAFELAKQYNISYLVVSVPYKQENFSDATPCYQNPNIRIYKVV